jgi:hypothetical protein
MMSLTGIHTDDVVSIYPMVRIWSIKESLDLLLERSKRLVTDVYAISLK